MGERITAYCSSQAQPMAVGLAALVHCVRGPPGARARRDGLEHNASTHRATELGQVGELEEWRICYKVTNGHSNTKNIVTTNKLGRTSFLKARGSPCRWELPGTSCPGSADCCFKVRRFAIMLMYSFPAKATEPATDRPC